MPPKGTKRRAGSISASTLAEASIVSASATGSVHATHIAEKGAEVTHTVLKNKSGYPKAIDTQHDYAYEASKGYMTPSGKQFDATPPTWVVYWFLISATIMLWDAGFVLTREQYSNTPWHQFIWYAYHNKYASVDKFYGDYNDSLKPHSAGYLAWARSQTQVNVAEIVGQYLAVVFSASPIGSVVGLIVSVSTFIKTVLYMLMIFNSPEPAKVVPSLAFATAQDYTDFWGFFIMTNGWWIVIPGLCIISLSRRLIAGTLHA